MRNFLKRHLVESFFLSDGLIPNSYVYLVLCLETLLLIRFSLVSLLQSSFIIDNAIDRIVKHTIALDDSWELFHYIFAMILSLLSLLCLVLFFYISIDITDSDWVKIMGFPVLLGSFVFKNFLINLHLFFMVLQITVVDHIIVSLHCRLDGFASHSLFNQAGISYEKNH